MTSPIAGPGGSLSLQQKQKMLADSEHLQRMTNQPKLSPITSSGRTTNSTMHAKGLTTGAKDLTASLMTANLNQMNSGQSSFSSSGGFNKMGSSPNSSIQGILNKPSIPCIINYAVLRHNFTLYFIIRDGCISYMLFYI